MRLLSRQEGAELLFAAHKLPAHPEDLQDVLFEEVLAHHGDRAHYADELADEYGDHQQAAAARMLACLAAVPGDVAVPDGAHWPERGEDGHLYTGMGDDSE